ncbi:hypothetical protein ACFLS0_03865 [Candidatus Bipolaricaulota bacterium]
MSELLSDNGPLFRSPTSNVARAFTQTKPRRLTNETKRLWIDSLHPGTSLDTVAESTGFELLISGSLQNTSPSVKRN